MNDEWEAFGQLSWLDPRTTSGDWRVAQDFSGLPAWIVKAVGGTTIHWAGASLRFQEHEWKALTTYGPVAGANLLDWPIDGAEMAPWYEKAEAKLGVTQTGGRPALPGNNNYKVFEAGAQGDRLQGGLDRADGDQLGRLRRPDAVPADRLLLPGLQVGRQVVGGLYRHPARRGDRQPRGARPRPRC